MQKGLVVCYESRTLNEHEQNYLTHDLELERIIHAFSMRKHYLLGRRFVLMSDHSGLRYLFENLNLNSSKDRWLAMISEFDLEIRYIKGKENNVVDTLRRIQMNHIPYMRSYGIDLQDEILQEGQQDDRYNELMHRLSQGTCDQNMDYHLMANDLVIFQDRTYVADNNELKMVILKEFHAKPYLFHLCYQRTLTMVKNFYYWTNLKSEVANFVPICLDYQQMKTQCKHTDRLLQTLMITEWKWEVISTDFIIGFAKDIQIT